MFTTDFTALDLANFIKACETYRDLTEIMDGVEDLDEKLLLTAWEILMGARSEALEKIGAAVPKNKIETIRALKFWGQTSIYLKMEEAEGATKVYRIMAKNPKTPESDQYCFTWSGKPEDGIRRAEKEASAHGFTDLNSFYAIRKA